MLQGLRKGPLEGVIVMESFSQEEEACARVMEIEAGAPAQVHQVGTGGGGACKRSLRVYIPPTPAINKLTKLAPSMLGRASMNHDAHPNIEGASFVNLFFAGVVRMNRMIPAHDMA